MEFNCNWDTFTIILTVLVNIILLFIIISLVKKACCVNSLVIKFLLVGISLILFATLIVPPLYSPRKIILQEDAIHVKQIKGEIIIPFDQITEIRTPDNSEEQGNIRKFGSGGFWGNLGYFNSPKLGKYQKFVTNRDDKILIETTNSIYIISSNNADILINKVKQEITAQPVS